MSMAQTIELKLKAALSPLEIEVIDNSHHHIGHAGYREGGESHWKVVITSEAFNGKNRLARQRLVNQALAEELKGPIHALEMDLKGTGNKASSRNNFFS